MCYAVFTFYTFHPNILFVPISIFGFIRNVHIVKQNEKRNELTVCSVVSDAEDGDSIGSLDVEYTLLMGIRSTCVIVSGDLFKYSVSDQTTIVSLFKCGEFS